MTPARKAATADWPRLDLPKHQYQRLSMSWITGMNDPADADDGIDLLEDLILEGVSSALTRDTRDRIDLRCVHVAIPREEGGYDVQGTYEFDPDWLPWREQNDKTRINAFVAFTRSITDAPTAECRGDFLFPGEIGYATVVRPGAKATWAVADWRGIRNPGCWSQPGQS